MRVIGVTTTLARDKMLAQGPDAVRPTIAEISVEDLTGLRRTAAAAEPEEPASDRTASNQAAGPADNVRA